MSKQLTVTATRIRCHDPQDPFLDELYFITGSKEKSHTSVTKRKIRKGFDEPVKIELLKTEIDETGITPIQVTLWEQRALRDNSAAAKALQDNAAKAAKFAKEHFKGLAWPELVIQISGWLLDNAASFFKHIFRDSPLGTKEIVIPRVAAKDENHDFPASIDGQYQVHFTAEGHKGSYYHYDIDIAVVIE